MHTETLTPLFLEGENGSLFCLFGSKNDDKSSGVADQSELFRKPHNKRQNHIVLFLPPFGEELNLCRRFYSGVREQLTRHDFITVQPDLYGTGDSAGLLEEATWGIWQADLRCVIQHVAVLSGAGSEPVELSILAVRAGCLMIPDVIRICDDDTPSLRLRNLVIVQPEHKGEDVLNRLFRARTISQQLAGDKSQSVQDLWELIERGDTVHAGGHSLSAQLCQSLRNQNIHGLLTSHAGIHRTWFDLSVKSAVNNETASAAMTWAVEGCTPTPFWQSYDLEPDVSLIEAVVSAVIR